LLVTAWGALALWFQLSRPGGYAAIALWSLASLAATIAIARGPGKWPGARALVTGAVALAVLLGWWLSLTPSHDRVWADDVSRMLVSHVDGDRLVLQNVRNFEWRTETDYTPRWETRDYDLAGIVSADLILSYWMGPHIAHTLVTFGFKDGKQLVFSLEIRKERTETFSAVGGFFRQFEQVIIASDERDLIRALCYWPTWSAPTHCAASPSFTTRSPATARRSCTNWRTALRPTCRSTTACWHRATLPNTRTTRMH
jgi:hypothetical protein